MHDVPKWSETLSKSCSICCKIFSVSDHFGTSCIKIKAKEISAAKVQIWHSFIWNGLVLVCDDLRDMVPLAQLKKNLENTHGGLLLLVLKATLLHGCFSRVFFRLYKWYQFPRSSSFLFSSFKACVGVAESHWRWKMVFS